MTQRIFTKNDTVNVYPVGYVGTNLWSLLHSAQMGSYTAAAPDAARDYLVCNMQNCNSSIPPYRINQYYEV